MNLKNWILVNGLTMTKLASAADVSFSSVRRVAGGAPAGGRVALKLHAATGGQVSLRSLLEGQAA